MLLTSEENLLTPSRYEAAHQSTIRVSAYRELIDLINISFPAAVIFVEAQQYVNFLLIRSVLTSHNPFELPLTNLSSTKFFAYHNPHTVLGGCQQSLDVYRVLET